MKQTLHKPEFEGEFVDENGHLHADTGDCWHRDMPRELWTPEARQVFFAAVEAGLLEFHPYEDYYIAGEGVTKPQLAYWCKCASTHLHLDKGEKRTNWKVFEAVFNPSKTETPMRLCLHDIDEAKAPEMQTAVIDTFFDNLNEQ